MRQAPVDCGGIPNTAQNSPKAPRGRSRTGWLLAIRPSDSRSFDSRDARPCSSANRSTFSANDSPTFVAIGRSQEKTLFGEIEFESAGFAEIFVARHRPEGSLLSAERVGGPFQDSGQRIAAMPDHSVFFSMVVSGVVDVLDGQVGEDTRAQVAMARLDLR